MDKAHEDVCGPAVVHLLKRAYTLYGDARYERLADLSSSHLYNLRKSAGYSSTSAPVLPRPARCAIPLVCAKRPERVLAQASFALTASTRVTWTINKQVPQMLNKLNIEQTKSRARHSNDLRPGGEQECQRGA